MSKAPEVSIPSIEAWTKAAAKSAPIHAVTYQEASFRWARNEDAMATEKLAEGIRAFAADAVKLDTMIQELAR